MNQEHLLQLDHLKEKDLSDQFTLFPECLIKEYLMCHENKAQVLEIYNSNDKFITFKNKPTTPVFDMSAVVCAKAVICKNIHQFLFELVCSI